MTKYVFVQLEVTGAGGTTVYPNGATITVNEPLAIVAVYAVMEHLVTFNSVPITVAYNQPSGQGGGSALSVSDGTTITIQAPNEVIV